MVNEGKKTLHGITKLVEGNTVKLNRIADGDEQDDKIKSKYGGPVVSFSFVPKNPPAKKIFVNRVTHDGTNMEISVFNNSGAEIDVEVTGWEIPLV